MTPCLPAALSPTGKVPVGGAGKEAPAESPQLPEARHKEGIP